MSHRPVPPRAPAAATAGSDLATVHPDDAVHDHDHGLLADLSLLAHRAARRRTLRWLAGAGAVALVGCGGGSSGTDAATSTAGGTGSSGSSGSTTSGGSTGSTGTCSVIPEETAGPYPGDGSNASNGAIANALALSGIVRRDIRSSIAGATGTAAGVPLRVILELVNTSGSCATLAEYAVYLWHCDAVGRYSMYSSGVTGENYLRGVQPSGSDGTAVFDTIFPGCYSGRMPHIHFEIYRATNTATAWTNKLRTSQLALPTDVCTQVYTGAGSYTGSLANLNAISFATDNVFSDGVTTQLATVTGNVTDGYIARLRVGIAA